MNPGPLLIRRDSQTDYIHLTGIARWNARCGATAFAGSALVDVPQAISTTASVASGVAAAASIQAVKRRLSLIGRTLAIRRAVFGAMAFQQAAKLRDGGVFGSTLSSASSVTLRVQRRAVLVARSVLDRSLRRRANKLIRNERGHPPSRYRQFPASQDESARSRSVREASECEHRRLPQRRRTAGASASHSVTPVDGFEYPLPRAHRLNRIIFTASELSLKERWFTR